MPQPIGVGDVVSGRYRVTHHVVTSADQDIVFQAVDEVLGREVSVLLASAANAKQVATSAKELATGERSSEVDVLDLGLAENRTYLISTLVDPNQLLDLVVPDSAPYVEPYYTDSLGSELFGAPREMEPQTYDDDAEYYARIHADRGRRPAFLDKVTPAHRKPAETGPRRVKAATRAELQSELESAGDAHGISISQEIAKVGISLRSDLDEVPANPEADAEGESIEATAAPGEVRAAAPSPEDEPAPAEPSGGVLQEVDPAQVNPAADDPEEITAAAAAADYQDASGPHVEHAPSSAISTLAPAPAVEAPTNPAGPAPETIIAEGEEVIDNPPEVPDESYDRREIPDPSLLAPVAEQQGDQPAQVMDPHGGSATGQGPSSFTGLINTVPSREPAVFPSAQGGEQPNQARPASVPTESKVNPRLWLAATVLSVLVIIAAVIVFLTLSN
ncbi:hypothetical protein HGQ17_10670 [Nesterenkonia sp. MY13]|uniref:Uncharacterized protein n=1 Tax=Nesterenkonia sedimenti TaxID=1463632 RepID=A0A7X8TKN4_9MICC|nr:hypothetical protein [Nesterenkonia sedimenti]NLS10443.1 hypothetical protein [Nesterenkonia sedimenti]